MHYDHFTQSENHRIMQLYYVNMDCWRRESPGASGQVVTLATVVCLRWWHWPRVIRHHPPVSVCHHLCHHISTVSTCWSQLSGHSLVLAGCTSWVTDQEHWPQPTWAATTTRCYPCDYDYPVSVDVDCWPVCDMSTRPCLWSSKPPDSQWSSDHETGATSQFLTLQWPVISCETGKIS